MEFLQKLDMSTGKLLKFGGLAVIALIVLSLVVSVFKNTLGLSVGELGIGGTSSNMAPMAPGAPSYYGGGDDVAYREELSIRNVTDSYMPPIDGGYASGDESEAFEVKEYSSTIETRDLKRDCTVIRSLKSRNDVIFENMNEYDRGCNFTFKVKRESVEEILALMEDLDPKEQSENIYTIKRQVDDFTSEVEILEKKLASLDKTLEDAILAYDNVTALASRTQDVESLAKIIDSKLNIIERLTQAKINTSAELDRVNRAKADALDRLNYTYFYVSVYENKFADVEELKDSWKMGIKETIREVNSIAQDMSIELVALLFAIVKYALYFFILLFVARFGWGVTKRVWNGEQRTPPHTP